LEAVPEAEAIAVPLLNSALVHPHLLAQLAPKFFPDSAAIQQLPLETLNALHDPSAQTDWATVTGLAAIPCRVSNIPTKRGDEIRTPTTTYVSTTYWIVLAGCFPQIKETYSVLITHPEGQTRYNITSIYIDGLRKITKLEGQVIT
jgi:hypothetical protein